MNKKEGMSLLELMVVVAILGIVMGVTFTRIDGLTPSSRLSAGARELASTIILTKEGAILNCAKTQMYYDLDKMTYWAQFPPLKPQDKPRIYNRRPLPSNVRFLDIMVSTEKVVKNGKLETTFSPNGTASPITIHLVNELKKEVTVTVNPLTGIVDIYEGHKNPDTIEKIQ